MAQYFTKSLYICTVIIALFASITSASLSVEELSLKVQQLELNDATKDARLQQLELKVQHLETKLIEKEKECQHLSKKTTDLMENQADQRNVLSRTCTELRKSDASLSSGMYWIDPDGQGVGDDPIYVHCDMTTGKTSVLHDSEDPTDVGHCADPGCYSRSIIYSATTRQMEALSELSSECHQSIKYDCNLAPFETSGVAQSWWNDKNGVAQYFWSGNNNSVHTCQCGIEHNCIETYNYCNCDSAIPIPLNDSGIITDKKYLPITRLNFGRTPFESSSGVHTLGRFECSGQISVTGTPTSCSDLWQIGHTLSGIYSVKGTDYIETVYCDFTKLPQEQGFQTWFGFTDVKTLPVYFYVQKLAPYSVDGGIIPFEKTLLNIGGAMNTTAGIFTAPQNGVYSFHFSGIAYYPSYGVRVNVVFSLLRNGNIVGSSSTSSNDDDAYYTHTVHSTIELRKGDTVAMSIQNLNGGAYLYDDNTNIRHTHFTGHLLHEKVATSMN